MKYITCVFILILFTACSQECIGDSFDERAISLHEKGLEFHYESKYDSAIVYFKQATEVDSCYPQSYASLFSAYVAIEEFEKALQNLKIIIDKTPENGRSWMVYGMLNELTENKKQAQISYEKSIKFYEKKMKSSIRTFELNDLKFNIAILYILSDRKSEGKAMIRRLAKNNPDNKKYNDAIEYDESKWFEIFLGVKKKP